MPPWPSSAVSSYVPATTVPTPNDAGPFAEGPFNVRSVASGAISAVSYPVVRIPRLLPLLALSVFSLAAKAPAPPEDTGPPIDVSAYRDKLIVLTDGKQHLVALVPFGDP